MIVGDLIKLLQTYPGDWKVTITDGFQARCYDGNFEVLPFEEENGVMTVDIGIGGTDQPEDT